MTDESERPSVCVPYSEGQPQPPGNWTKVKILKEDGSDLGMWWFNRGTLNQEPIVNEDIGKLIPRIRWLWRHLPREMIVDYRALEDFELKYMRSEDPEHDLNFEMSFEYARATILHELPGADWLEVFSGLYRKGPKNGLGPKGTVRRLKKLLEDLRPEFQNPENYSEDGYLKVCPEYLR